MVESLSSFNNWSEDNQEEMGFMMGTTRRRFLKTTGTAMGAGLMLPNWLGDLAYGLEQETKSSENRLRLGSIGVGGQGTSIMNQGMRYADLIAVCDVDRDHAERAEQMQKFREKVTLLANGLNQIDGFHTLDPAATFYVFPNVAPVCNRLGITSHGLALYLLEAADDQFGVACLGGECFGAAGHGFLRFSCAEPNDRLQQALDFLPVAISREDRVQAYLSAKPQHRLVEPYPPQG